MAGPIPAAQLAQARADLTGTFPGTAVIATPGTVSDGHGGWSENWVNSGTVAALLHPLDAGEEMWGGQLRGRQGYVLSVPHDTALGEAMRVTYDGVTHEVVGVVEWGPNRLARRAILVRTD